MRIVLFICSTFCVLMALGCIHKSTSLQKVKMNCSCVSVNDDNKSIVLQLMNSDTIALPVGKATVVMTNNTDSVYTTGTYYKIERLEDKEWIEIPRKYGSFEDIGYVIKPNGGKWTFIINLENVKYTYKEEVYRICKIISKGENKQYLYCTFYIRKSVYK